MSVEGGFGLIVTVEMSLELIKLLSEDWSEPIQVKVQRLPVDRQQRATHEMVARRVQIDKPIDDQGAG